jgi:hypothetical protein
MPRKFAFWAAAALVILFVVKAPSQASLTLQKLADGLATAYDQVGTFVNKVVS